LRKSLPRFVLTTENCHLTLPGRAEFASS
jgi:hypothetical protein